MVASKLLELWTRVRLLDCTHLGWGVWRKHLPSKSQAGAGAPYSGRPLVLHFPLPLRAQGQPVVPYHPDIKEKTHFLGNVFNKIKLQKKIKDPFPFLCALPNNAPFFTTVAPFLGHTQRLPISLELDGFSFYSGDFCVFSSDISHSHTPTWSPRPCHQMQLLCTERTEGK